MTTARTKKDLQVNKIQTMKASQLSKAERTAGISLGTLEDPNAPKTDLLIALGWVLALEAEPNLTFEAYGESRTLTEITEELGISE